MGAMVRVRSLAGFVVAGFAAALLMMVVMWAMRADAAPGDSDTTFVPITACRLVDTRPGVNLVGPRSAPLGTGDTYTVDLQHPSTKCAGKVPATATALSLNVTAVQTSASTFVSIWDEGPWPGTSSLNPVPGPPVPNAVTTKLSAADTFEIYNDAGSTHLIVDIGGYFTDASLDELDGRLAALESAGVDQNVLDRLDELDDKIMALETDNATQAAKIAALESDNASQAGEITALESENATQAGEIAALESKNTTLSTRTFELEVKTSPMSILYVESRPTVRFTGVNVQIVDGSNDTAGSSNGRGNLIVGYNENDGSDLRTGSHNLVVGRHHSYTSSSGFVAGFDNTVNGSDASVSGGRSNVALGPSSSVSGGYINHANGTASSVSGGRDNISSGDVASVSGGAGNKASGSSSSVLGGNINTAEGVASSVSGGVYNTASGNHDTVIGGDGLTCIDESAFLQGVACGEGTITAVDAAYRP